MEGTLEASTIGATDGFITKLSVAIVIEELGTPSHGSRRGRRPDFRSNLSLTQQAKLATASGRNVFNHERGCTTLRTYSNIAIVLTL